MHPKHGYGTAINPCIDCHIFMFQEANKLAKKLFKKDFIIATGEVAEERPFSQNFRALKIIEQEAGLMNKILRPLSAKILEKTEAEKTGSINRDKLFGIRGRGRKIQEGLTGKFKIKEYQQPAGGCFLCEPNFAERFRTVLKYKANHKEKISMLDLALLRYGRHFFTKNAWIVVGRNEIDNFQIAKLKEKSDKLIEISNLPGPTTLVKSLDKKRKVNKKDIERAKELTLEYSSKKPEYLGLKPKFIIKN
jgi:hypothetical protein